MLGLQLGGQSHPKPETLKVENTVFTLRPWLHRQSGAESPKASARMQIGFRVWGLVMHSSSDVQLEM